MLAAANSYWYIVVGSNGNGERGWNKRTYGRRLALTSMNDAEYYQVFEIYKGGLPQADTLLYNHCPALIPLTARTYYQ
jgi:hypothetical protein